MNDRFKFRFWDKKEKEYFTCGDIDHKSGIFKTYPYITYNWCFEHKNIVAEQCTGLKDKNGKLIYENDLIKCPTGIYRIAVDDFGLWTVIYNNNPFEEVGEWGDVVKEYAFNQNNVEIEVLGNIHENADLLE